MAENHRLLIIVSDKLRGGEFLDLHSSVTDALVVGSRKLMVEKEPAKDSDPWEKELRDVLIGKIKSQEDWHTARVRVAGHLRSCFGDDPRVLRERDQRFHEKEESLKARLEHDIDVQVWGFHHEEEWSEIWRTVVQLIRIIEASEEAEKIGFLEALENVFESGSQAFESDVAIEQNRRVWEKLSVLKHQIMGLLDPLRIRLQTASEARREKLPWADERFASIDNALDVKLPEARRLLAECYGDVSSGESFERWEEASEHLAQRPNLGEFPQWLDELNDRLTELRDSVKK